MWPLTDFYRYFNWIEVLFCSDQYSDKVIITKFCTWHDRCAAVACTYISCDQWPLLVMRVKLNPIIDKKAYTWCVEWDYLSIPKLTLAVAPLNFFGNLIPHLIMDVINFIPHFIMDVITYPCWD